MSEKKFIVFFAAGERYGFEIELVERIMPSQETVRLPGCSEEQLGVFDLRGETVLAVDLRKLMGLSTEGKGENFVIASSSNHKCAFLVDSIDGICTFAEEEIDEAPSVHFTRGNGAITGIGKKEDTLIVLLDANELIPHESAVEVSA